MLPLLPLLIAFHTLTSPYTKVEESFTLHAVRDILLHGRQIHQVRLFCLLPLREWNVDIILSSMITSNIQAHYRGRSFRRCS